MIQIPADDMGAVRWLAQASGLPGGTAQPVTILLWVGVLMVVVIGGGFLVMALRRNLLGKDGDSGALGGGGMMLDELRAMRRRGELSDDEYETARDALTSTLTGKTPLSLPPPPPPRRDPTVRAGNTLVARPGFDLTGQPLPQPGGPRPPTQGERKRTSGERKGPRPPDRGPEVDE